jgi:hypothetical protein
VTNATTSVGIRTTTIQAPWVNFVTAMTTMTSPVAVAPIPCTVTPDTHPGWWRRSQYRTMLACLSVKERNTPTA